MEDFKDLIKRIFVPQRPMSHIFSIARFLFLLVGAGAAAVYFATEHNEWAAIGFAITAYILYRYGQIKGYLK